ncbi:MAG: sugar transferase [Bacteroidota bacterium]
MNKEEMTQLYSKIKYYRDNNRGNAKRVLDLIELGIVAVSFPLVAFIAKSTFMPQLNIREIHGIIFFLMVMMSWFVLSRVTAVAKVPRTQRYLTLILQVGRITFINFLGLLAVKVIFRLTTIPVELILLYIALMFFLDVIFRILAFKALKSYRIAGHSLHHVLVVADSFSDGVIERLQEQKEWGFQIHGIMTNSKLIIAKYGESIQIYPETENLKSILDKEVIDEVLYCKKKVDSAVIKGIANICSETGVIFRLQSTVSPIDPVQFQLQTVAEPESLTLIDAPANNLSLVLKNMGDIYFSLIALILLLPVFLVIGTLIKLDSRGPVFFLQERIGLRGRKFKLYKFRTMVTNAEALLEKLVEKNEADGPVFKIKEDPRITRVGKFLRKTGLDELPQLINVLKGEMSLVGPRPPLEREVKKYKRWQLRRLSVKPGITCTWQIVPDRHNVSFEKWMELDIRYINNWNIFRDLGLFFKTLRTFFMAGGH